MQIPSSFHVPTSGGRPRLVGLALIAGLVLAGLSALALAAVEGRTTIALAQASAGEHPRLAEARRLIEAHQPESALRILRSFVRDEANARYLDQALLLLAAGLMRTQALEEAVTTLEQLLEEAPDSPLAHRARLMLASAHAELGHLDLALPLLAEVRSLAEDASTRREALALTGSLLVQRGDHLRAIQAWLEEAQLAPEGERAVPRERIRQLIMGQLAPKDLERVQQVYPGTYPSDIALIRLIEVHLARDEQYAAERMLRRFLKQFPMHEYAKTADELLESFAAELRNSEHVIAALLPLSGPLSRFGHESLRGIRVALDRGKALYELPSIALAVKDAESDKVFLRSELYEMIDRHRPLAVIGPMRSREVLKLAELADRTETPFITPSATLLDVRRLGHFVFSTSVTYSLQARRLADYAMGRRGLFQFGVLHPDTYYGRELARLFSQEVRQRGGAIVAVESYPEQATDFGPQIRRMKAADLQREGVMTETTGPAGDSRQVYTPGFDAIFVPGTASDVALISPQLLFYDIQVPLLGANGWNAPELLRLTDASLNGSLFVDGFYLDSPDPDVVDFVSRYRRRYQQAPSLFAAQAYDAARSVIEALRRGASSAREVAQALRQLDDLPAFGGAAGFDARGVLNRRLFVLQVKDGGIEPAEAVNGAMPRGPLLGPQPATTSP